VGRFLLFSAIVGSVVIFVIVLRTPNPLPWIHGFSSGPTLTEQSSQPSPPAASRATPAVVQKKKAKNNASRPANASRVESAFKNIETTPVDLLSPQDEQRRTAVTVKTDSAAVYPVNSAASPILQLLQRGDRVVPDIEVLDMSGRWTLVRAIGYDGSGYVRSESLERP
jgi:hypothetical protein